MDGMTTIPNLSDENTLEISSEELIKSLGDSASFGSLKKLLNQVDDIDVVDVRYITVTAFLFFY
jgi:hypothetical protein